MQELKPCAFCGHDEARVIVVDKVTDAGAEGATVPIFAASCPYCGAAGSMELSYDEAVEAWNRRSERTCHDEAESPQSFMCGECGWFWIDPEDELGFRYCPKCGARVVEE